MDVAELRAAAAESPRGPSAATGWGVAGIALGVAVVAALAVGWAWSALTRPDPAPRLTPGSAQLGSAASLSIAAGSDRVAWADVLADLDATRSEAFAVGDAALLDEVYAEGSALLVEDRERLEQLRAAGVIAHGLRPELTHVALVQTGPGSVVLSVHDQLPPYEFIGTAGDVVARRPAREQREWLITLVPAGSPEGEWRISDITPAGPDDARQ